jgi:hypothetical protein
MFSTNKKNTKEKRKLTVTMYLALFWTIFVFVTPTLTFLVLQNIDRAYNKKLVSIQN